MRSVVLMRIANKRTERQPSNAWKKHTLLVLGGSKQFVSKQPRLLIVAARLPCTRIEMGIISLKILGEVAITAVS